MMVLPCSQAIRFRWGLIISIIYLITGGLLSACSATTSPAANPTLPVKTMQITLDGSSHTILTDSRGFALYFYIPDTPTRTACTDDCAIEWPPLLAADEKGTFSSVQLPGTFTVQQTANGKQVEYNKHLLYTYKSDKEPGQVTGNGVKAWYVATPDLKPPTTGLPPAPT